MERMNMTRIIRTFHSIVLSATETLYSSYTHNSAKFIYSIVDSLFFVRFIRIDFESRKSTRQEHTYNWMLAHVCRRHQLSIACMLVLLATSSGCVANRTDFTLIFLFRSLWNFPLVLPLSPSPTSSSSISIQLSCYEHNLRYSDAVMILN